MQEKRTETVELTQYEIERRAGDHLMSWASTNHHQQLHVNVTENVLFIRHFNKYFTCSTSEFLINPQKIYYLGH